MQGGCDWGKQASLILTTIETAVINEPKLILIELLYVMS